MSEVLQWSFQKDIMSKVTCILNSREYIALHQKQWINDLAYNRSSYFKEKIMVRVIISGNVCSVAHHIQKNLLLQNSDSSNSLAISWESYTSFQKDWKVVTHTIEKSFQSDWSLGYHTLLTEKKGFCYWYTHLRFIIAIVCAQPRT